MVAICVMDVCVVRRVGGVFWSSRLIYFVGHRENLVCVVGDVCRVCVSF